MGIARANKNFNSFINGIVTDANEFNAPESAVEDAVNVNVNDKGEALRRLGLKETDTNSYFGGSLGVDDSICTQVVDWPGAGTDRATDLLAVQVGQTLQVFDASKADINGYSEAVISLGTSLVIPWKMFPGDDGCLYILTGNDHIQRVVFTYGSPSTLTTTDSYIYIRDTEGLDDSLDIDEHPISLSADHHYNLLNQGWNYTKINDYAGGGGTWQATTAYALFDVVRPTTPNGYYYKATTSGTTAATEPTWPTTVGAAVADGTVIWTNQGAANYPSNSQQWFQGRDSSGNFSPSELRKLDFGKAPAPRGRYIYRLDNIDRSTYVSGATDETMTYVNARVGAYYAGRMFYAGITENSRSNQIFYSQIVTKGNNPHGHFPYSACYSNNDVTSEYFNEPLASDGGVLVIPEMGIPVDMQVLGNSLIVLTQKGIWAINGGFAETFSGTSVNVAKISELNCGEGHMHIVNAGNVIYFWTDFAIQGITETAQQGVYDIFSLTDKRYKEGYKNILALIGTTPRYYVRGHFDKNKNFIEWAYPNNTTISGTFTSLEGGEFRHSNILRYNITTGAFTTYKLAATDQAGIGGMGESRADTDNVYYLARWYADASDNFRYKWCKLSDTDFEDYSGLTGIASAIDAPAYLTSWPVHVGAPDKDKQAQYLTTFLRRTETQWIAASTFDSPSGMTASVWWDWYGIEESVKKNGPHNVYRMLRLESDPGSYPTDLVYNKKVVVNKTKIRGKGHAYTVRFDSVAGKDFQFLGWSTPLLVETEV